MGFFFFGFLKKQFFPRLSPPPQKSFIPPEAPPKHPFTYLVLAITSLLLPFSLKSFPSQK